MKRLVSLLISLVLIGQAELGLSQNNYFPLSITNDSLISFYTEQVNPDSVESYVSMLENLETRFMMSPNRKAVAEIIQNKFLALGVEMARIDSFQCTTFINMWNLHYDTTTWQYNVVATIPGITNSNEIYVMGAHYDDVVAPNGDPMIYVPGADDNASGVSALFEVARIIQSNSYYPIHTIELVAFAAEELMNFGNSGSQKYVEQAIANGLDIKLMINNDMIAYTDDQPWKIRISNYIGSENLTWVSEYITETFTDISPVILAPSNEGSADCKYFVEAGIPSVYFFEKVFNPFYHTDLDLLENCNMSYCSEAVKISIGLLIGIDDSTVDVAESEDLSQVKIYPNPASDYLKIKLNLVNENSPINYSIFDQTGRVVQDGLLNDITVKTLNISRLNDGIYILQLISKNDYYTSKLIIH